jgi:hypothetical protein
MFLWFGYLREGWKWSSFLFHFSGLGRRQNPENEIKKAGTESPTPHFFCGDTPKEKLSF